MSSFNTNQFCLSALWQRRRRFDAAVEHFILWYNTRRVDLIEDIHLNYYFHVSIARVLRGAPILNLIYSLHM